MCFVFTHSQCGTAMSVSSFLEFLPELEMVLVHCVSNNKTGYTHVSRPKPFYLFITGVT